MVSVAEEERSWIIRYKSDKYPGKTFQFPVHAFTHPDAKRKGEAKLRDGEHLTDVVLHTKKPRFI